MYSNQGQTRSTRIVPCCCSCGVQRLGQQVIWVWISSCLLYSRAGSYIDKRSQQRAVFAQKNLTFTRLANPAMTPQASSRCCHGIQRSHRPRYPRLPSSLLMMGVWGVKQRAGAVVQAGLHLQATRNTRATARLSRLSRCHSHVYCSSACLLLRWRLRCCALGADRPGGVCVCAGFGSP